MKKILITYYTKTGTTKKISEEIGTILGNHNFEVDVLPMSAVIAFEKYSGIVVGTPIHGMNLAQEATKFIQSYETELQKVPTAFFNVSYMIYHGRKVWKNAINKSFNKVNNYVKPVAIGMFGGRIDEMFPAPARFIFGISKETPLETTNWDSVKKWAEELCSIFNSAIS